MLKRIFENCQQRPPSMRRSEGVSDIGYPLGKLLILFGFVFAGAES